MNPVLEHEPRRDFVMVVEAGDVLAPDCFFEIAHLARQDPLLDLVYWDDDRLDVQGRRTDPQFRPSWSPDMLLGANYIGRSFAMRHRRFAAVGGLRTEFGDARLVGPPPARRARRDACRPGAACAHPSRPAAEPERRAVRQRGRGPRGAQRAARDGHVRARHGAARPGSPADWPHVTVVIPTRHNRPLVSRVLEGLARDRLPGARRGRRRQRRAHRRQRAVVRRHVPRPRRSTVEWWTKPFNYSAVNNAGAASARGEVLVFLNDDTELPEPAVAARDGRLGRAARDRRRGRAAARRRRHDPARRRDPRAHRLRRPPLPGHAPRFAVAVRVRPSWYRNVLAVTGACLAVRRSVFEELGGLRRAVRALRQRRRARSRRRDRGHAQRLHAVHRRAAPRGIDPRHRHPPADFFASYWRYQHWVFGGDPYFSPNLSLASRTPALRSRFEPTPADADVGAARPRARACSASRATARSRSRSPTCTASPTPTRVRSKACTPRTAPRSTSKSINWFLPDIDSPFYGGINTALRLADHLARTHGVENRFVFWAEENDEFFRSAIAAAFPALASSPFVVPRRVARRHRPRARRPTSRSRRCGRPRTPSRSTRRRGGSST